MLLRLSGQMSGVDVSLAAIGETETSDAGVELGTELRAFARAAIRRSEDLDERRAALVAAAGEATTARAAGIIANFDAITKVADATGIELDAMLASVSDEVLTAVGFKRN